MKNVRGTLDTAELTYAERAIVEMLRRASAEHPLLLQYISAIERGDHLRRAGAGRTTMEIPVQDLADLIERSAA